LWEFTLKEYRLEYLMVMGVQGLSVSKPTNSKLELFVSMLLKSGLQATRALMVAAILLGLVAIFVAVTGMKCMKCMEDDQVKKMRMAVFGGVIFITAGLAALVATSWYGNRVARAFYDPFTPINTRFEFGSALFIGWAAASLAILGGAFLCCSCPRRETSYPPTRGYPKNAPSTGKDYV
ncbi:claudin-1, partial [Antrostomus carolinensis]|uniref:claudin-1 n=1 Tax=Antrostomus carolinensis TaxID=279965 RepID=UPI0010A97E78